ncbi:MAG: hypothetical protein ACRDN8_00115 [Thermoleophilaceae bacterium]
MVLRLAEALELPLRERNALLLAAGYAPAYRETRFDGPKLAPIRTALERVSRATTPVRRCSSTETAIFVSGNAAFGTLTEDVAAELIAPTINVPRLLLDPQGIAPRIVNLDAWAWHVIDALQREAARNPNDRLEARVSELKGLVPDRPQAAARSVRSETVGPISGWPPCCSVWRTSRQSPASSLRMLPARKC